MRTVTFVVLAASVASLSTGCVRRVILPPTEVPAEEVPAGMIDVNVVSEYEDQSWNVYSGGRVVCGTPCTQRLRLGDSLTLIADDGDRLDVDGIGIDAPEARRALLVAEGSHEGKRVNGIVWTTFGGMGVVVATTLTAVGCSDLTERRGMCNAGLITGGVTVPLTAFGIWLLLDSGPKAHVMPVVLKTSGLKGHPPVTATVTPTGVAGTF